MSPNWGDIPTWVGVLLGTGTILAGLREYRSSQQWKRAEFLASEIDRFFSSAKVTTALLLIDYSVIRLDEEGRRAGPAARGSHVFTDAMITEALRVHTEFPGDIEHFDGPEMLVREAFDELLTGLERFAHHVEIGLVTSADVAVYLGYWIEKLTQTRSEWKPAAFYDALAKFVDAYRYDGFRRLSADMGYPLPTPVSVP